MDGMIMLQPKGSIVTADEDLLKALYDAGYVFLKMPDDNKFYSKERGHRYGIYTLEEDEGEPSSKSKKQCKNCKHLIPDHVTVSDKGEVRGRGVCYNNPGAGRCYDNQKLVCEFSRQGCANFEPIEEESEDK